MLQFNVVNIANIGREIIVFHRIGKQLCQFHEKNFFPYFYQLSPTGIFKTIDNKKVNKVLCSRPSDLSRRRDENSYEADVNYCKRYIIDKIISFGKAELKYSFIDIEVLCPELPNYMDPKYPISCISCSNSYTGEIKTFYLKDYDEQIEDAEKQLLNDFVDFIRKEQFDLILGWNFVEFDWKYLQARYEYIFGCKLSEMLSPINQTKYLGSTDVPFPNTIPAGISVMDYLDMYKKIYKTESSYSLDSIALKELKIPLRKKIDFNKLTEDIKIKNIEDIRLLMEIDKQKKIIEYYDELRRMSMCEFSDVTWNSKMLDMILLKEAKQKNLILPSKHYGESQDNPFAGEETFQGAYRRCNILDENKNIIKRYTGLHKNIWKLDLGCYSEDTEILTEQGWKKYNELIKLGDRYIDQVATFNINKNYIEFQPILHLNIQKIKNEKMYNFKGETTDQLLTWNHKMLYYSSINNKHNINPNWKICHAKDYILSHNFLPLAAKIKDKKDYDISDELIKIHAWIITEGHNEIGHGSVKSNIYHISQSEKANLIFCKEIDVLFQKLNWKVSRYNRKGLRRGQIDWNLKQLYSTYIRLEDNHKVIPLWMLNNLSLRQLYILFLELNKGDGDKHRGCYYAKNCLARDRFQHLCLLLGISSYKNNRKEVYYRKINSCQIHQSNKIRFYTGLGKRIIKYSGIIWCPTVENGFVVMRRKGKTFISGNSAYPQMIRNFCLDIGNINKTGITINKVAFYQNSNALLPTIAQKLINKKDAIKKELKLLNPEIEEYRNLLIKYNAIKAVVNSLFGVCGLKIFRLFDYRIASAITFLVRDLLHYVEDKLQEEGKEIIYIDTDSIFCKSENNPKDRMNDLIKHWAKEKYNKDKIEIEFDLEGQYVKLFVVNLCHYKGLLKKKSGVEEEVKGIEAKRKDSSVFIKEFQTKLIEKVMNEEPKEEIIKWINSEKERIKTLPILDIGFPCKISKDAEEYKSVPVHIRALGYTKELVPTFDKRVGDSFYYIYVEPFGTSTRKSTRNKKNKETGDITVEASEKEVKKDVLVFDEENLNHVKNVDWKKMLDRSIYTKLEHIFEALAWDISEIKEVKVKKLRKKRIKEDDNLTLECEIMNAENHISNDEKREGRQIDSKTKEEER